MNRPHALPPAIGLVVMLAAGCGAAQHPHSGDRVSEPTPVTVHQVGDPGAIPALVLAGRVKARAEVTVTAPTAARLTALPRREGARFAAGEVLARFDAPETRALIEAAAERTIAATQRVERARRDEARAESLWVERVITDRDVEGARLERRAAQAEAASSRAEERSLREAAAVPAPFDGFVSRRHVDPGQWVSPGQALLDVRSLGVEGVEVAVPESAIPRLEDARAYVQQGEGPWLAARVVRADAMTDPATRTRDAVFRPDSGGATLEPGAYARVRLDRARADGGSAGPSADAPLGIPVSSVVRRGQLAGVYVVREGRAYLRWLRLGREASGQVEVLAGLTPGEHVIVAPAGLEDGRAVSVR